MDVLKVSLNLLVVLSSDGPAFQEYFELLTDVLSYSEFLLLLSHRQQVSWK